MPLLSPRREAEPWPEAMTTTDRVAAALRNRSQHAAVGHDGAPEHAAKEAQKPAPEAKVLTLEPEHVELPESGQECCS